MSQKILVIDDSLASSKAAETALSQSLGNVDVLLAQRGAEGFDRFLIAQPDLILLNESLPDMDGEAVVYRLLNDPLTSHVPVVVMSSNGHGEKLKQRYSNVVRTIQKPVSAESLLPVVSSPRPRPRPRPLASSYSATPPKSSSPATPDFSRSATPCRWLTAIK